MKVFTAIMLVLALILCIVLASKQQKQQPSPSYSATQEAQDNAIIKYALDNGQQEGYFYFLPFPPKNSGDPFPGNGFQNYNYGRLPNQQQRAQDAQMVLRILANFELMRKVEVVSFQLVRDQGAHFSSSVFHGIFLKAKPLAKTTTKPE